MPNIIMDIEENINFRIDKGTGYMYAYLPNHPLSNSAGKLLEHVYVMSKHIKRRLNDDECVHHKDRNKTNNDISNLQLMKRDEHARLHQIEDNLVEFVTVTCNYHSCDTSFTISSKNKRKYCSPKCGSLSQRKITLTKKDLQRLIWEMPIRDVAELYNVSDSAIHKKCRVLKLKKPPQGYWLRSQE